MIYWQLIKKDEVIKQYPDKWRLLVTAEDIMLKVKVEYIDEFIVERVVINGDVKTITSYSIYDFIRANHGPSYNNIMIAQYKDWKLHNDRF